MSFKVKVLLDSISPEGVRLTTFKNRFPREILAEVNTHTILSKNASSSRAIPGQRLREFIKQNLYIPEFGKNSSGMQSHELLDSWNTSEARITWVTAAERACWFAEQLEARGVHKQVVNRLVENFGWTNQVITGTEWSNFFALRTHKDAHPAFRTLARAMYVAYSRSTPRRLDYNEWHLPFVGQGTLKSLNVGLFGDYGNSEYHPDMSKMFPYDYERMGITLGMGAQIRSVACCARVSYQTLDGSPSTFWKDVSVYNKLLKEPPYHVSPFQNQATPFHPAQEASQPHLKSNLRGWIQYRKTIPNECITEFNPTPEEMTAWNIPEDIFTE